MLGMPALGRLRQEEAQKFKVSLGYRPRLLPKSSTKPNQSPKSKSKHSLISRVNLNLI